MKQKTLLTRCLMIAFCLFALNVYAFAESTSVQIVQQDTKPVTGQVLDENGDPVIGASINVKGTNINAVTDIDGNFSIDAPQGSTLIVSYLGYGSKEVAVTGNALSINIAQDTEVLNEVVVTALGIKKEAKSLSYNVQQLNSDAVMSVQDANFVNSLNGKVAGVQFSQSSSGVGGATRVVMRGNKSINGNNNVLYVVDGIPMQNLASDQPEDMYSGSGATGDAASNINPDDIESISVLSGPSASALYGAEASNGVILITTKKGQEGRLNVNYSGSFQWSTPFVKHKFQNTYGPSSTGAFDSWGQKLATPSSYDPNDFFQTGHNYTNSVSVSSGTERNQTYLSLAATNAEGIIHNNDFTRYNLSVRNTSKLLKNLTLDLSYMMSSVKEQNMVSSGQYHNPLYTLYLFPAGGDYEGMQYYSRYDAGRNLNTQYWPWLDQNDLMENPYWIAESERFINHKLRNTITGTLKWDLTDWISLTGRVKYDNSNEKYEQKFAAGTKTLFASDTGYYYLRHFGTSQFFAEAFATINKYFDEDRWSLTAILGMSYDQRKTEGDYAGGNLAMVPNLFSLNNIDNTDPKYKKGQDGSERKKKALYGSAQLGYKSMVYLDVTARNDWSSALAGANDSYFYWSAGLSGIWTEIFPQIKSDDYLNYLKTRISYAEVGNDPYELFLTIPTYPVTAAGPSTSTSKKNPNLTAERTKSWEFGLDFVMFRNKLKVNATLYHSRTYNQFFNIQLPESSGYTNMWINGGRVDNKGVELSARFTQPLGPVNWETYLTWTLNRNEVKDVVKEYYDAETDQTYTLDEMELGGFNGTRNKIVEGGDLSDIYVRTLKTGEHGEIYVNPQTHTVEADPNTYVLAGHASPNYTLSWGNTFTWNGFNLGFLFNYRNGGIVVSLTESLMDAFGTSATTAAARDNGGATVNGKIVPAQSFYQTISSTTTTLASQYVYSATNLRLAELTFGYDFPITKWVNWIKGLNVSFVAHNLLMLYCKAPVDPELTANTGTYNQGIDYFMQPSTRTLGFSVKVKF